SLRRTDREDSQMTLAQAFETFRTNLNLAPGQQQQITERRDRLIEHLQRTWGPAKIVPIGSYARGTSIPPVKDIDLMIVLAGISAEQRAPDSVLGEIESKLKVHYRDITRK